MGQVPPRAPHQRHRRRYRYRGRCREDQRYVDREVLMRKRAFTGFVLGTVLGAFGLCLGIIAHDTLTPTVLADVVCAQTQGCSILNPIFTGTAAMASGTFSGLLTANGGSPLPATPSTSGVAWSPAARPRPAPSPPAAAPPHPVPWEPAAPTQSERSSSPPAPGLQAPQDHSPSPSTQLLAPTTGLACSCRSTAPRPGMVELPSRAPARPPAPT